MCEIKQTKCFCWYAINTIYCIYFKAVMQASLTRNDEKTFTSFQSMTTVFCNNYERCILFNQLHLNASKHVKLMQ